MKKLIKITMLLAVVATTMIYASCDSGNDNWYDDTYNNQNTNNSGNDNTLNILADSYRDWETDRKSTRLNSSHRSLSRMPSSA